MEQWNLSDSMMNEEIGVQLVFPMLQLQRFAKAVRLKTISSLIEDVILMDEMLTAIYKNDFYVFDRQGQRIDANLMLASFGETDWIQLFVV